MDEIRKKIIAICENESLTGEALISELERAVAFIEPYDHDKDNPHEACGIKSNIELRIIGSGGISNIVERIERSLTKRKLAFILFQKIIEDAEDEDRPGKTVMHKRLKSDSPGDFEKTMRELMDLEIAGRNSEVTPETCREEDDSECWKCKYKPSCKKYKGFTGN